MKNQSLCGKRLRIDLFYAIGNPMIVLIIIFSAGAVPCKAEDSILTFYEKAVKRIDSPPDESRLSVECREKIDNLYVTFVGVEKGKVLLAAITEKKLKKPDKEIMLRVYLTKSLEKPILPTRDYIMDWGYVYDRNRDGKVDAVVVEALDPERNWVEGWMAVRSSKYDGAVDEGWFFKDDINVKEKDAERAGNGFRTRRIPGIEPVYGPDELVHKSKILNMFNEAAEKCKLTGGSFYSQ